MSSNKLKKKVINYKTKFKKKKELKKKNKLDTKTSYVVRIKPNIKWFENSRTLDENKFRSTKNFLDDKIKDPFSVILKKKQFPIIKSNYCREIKEIGFTGNVFEKINRRKRPVLKTNNLNIFFNEANMASNKFKKNIENKSINQYRYLNETKTVFLKGQTSRVKGELFKVIDSSDVLVQVLDSRDPLGTRLHCIEKYIKTHHCHKHLIFILNKVDLIPSWCTAYWVRHFSKSYPTLAFHAHISKSFGKGSLIQLLRQFAKLHSEKKKLNVGFIGYPNVGKSSIINTLKKKLVCKSGPIPGETKVWQYITLTSKIYLIDCPGVCFSNLKEATSEKILKGVIRIQNVKEVEQLIDDLFRRIRPECLKKAYGINCWKNSKDFLIKHAKRFGKLLKGGIPDIYNCGTMILQDWQKGKLPWFICPLYEKKINNNKNLNVFEKKKDYELVSIQLFNNLNRKYKFLEKDLDLDIFKEILKSVKKNPSKNDLKCMKVKKPMKILVNDPILIENRRRNWKCQKMKKK